MAGYPFHVKKKYRGRREVAPLILSSALDGGEWWKEAIFTCFYYVDHNCLYPPGQERTVDTSSVAHIQMVREGARGLVS